MTSTLKDWHYYWNVDFKAFEDKQMVFSVNTSDFTVHAMETEPPKFLNSFIIKNCCLSHSEIMQSIINWFEKTGKQTKYRVLHFEELYTLEKIFSFLIIRIYRIAPDKYIICNGNDEPIMLSKQGLLSLTPVNKFDIK